MAHTAPAAAATLGTAAAAAAVVCCLSLLQHLLEAAVKVTVKRGTQSLQQMQKAKQQQGSTFKSNPVSDLIGIELLS
jgi:cobalamin biosynthesis protein CbiD